MELRPIFSALLRNKTGAFLISLQIALTLAVVVNAVFIISQRIELMNRPTGMAVDNLIAVSSGGFTPDFDARGSIRDDLDALRAIPGVAAATVLNQIPLSGGGDTNTYLTAADVDRQNGVSANNYNCDEYCLTTLGVKLHAGRDFRSEEIADVQMNDSYHPPVVIITRALGKELFGDEEPLGKNIFNGLGESTTVIGVLEHMQGAWVNWDGLERVMIRPEIRVDPYTRYLVRAEPGQRDRLIPLVEKTLTDLNRNRIIRNVKSHTEIVAGSYASDRAMTLILSVVIALLVAITALGIVGLASFSVNQRTKQIGTRRAIGARRMHIMRYFLVENWMITSAGIVLGCVLSLLFNYWLVSEYSLQKLEFTYLAGGVAGLLLLGQIAVLLPARRAARIAPAIATRTV